MFMQSGTANFKLALVAVALMGGVTAFGGTTYEWKKSGDYGVNGNWQTPADWGGSGYPAAGDTASLPRGLYTITSSDDISVGTLSLAVFGAAAQVNPILDLGGNSLTCTS